MKTSSQSEMVRDTANMAYTNKKLSFLVNDDDDDDDGSDDDVINPLKRTSPLDADAKESQIKSHSNDATPVRSAKEKKGDHKKHSDSAKTSAKDDNDDASSTSSCSCEDHSSVVDDVDDPHGDLDYDDDSITHTPLRNSNRELDEPEETTINGKDNPDISPPATSLGESLSQTPIRDARELLSSNHHESRRNNRLEEDVEMSADLESAKSGDTQSLQRQRPRIKSIINPNHFRNMFNGTSADELSPKELSKSDKGYEELMKCFLKDACYFQIKSINHQNVELSKSMGIWSTPVQNEVRLNAAFMDHRNVILVFSVQQSGAFQGIARMTSESRPTKKSIPWVLPERLSATSLGGVFRVEWLCTKELSFTETQDLLNPYNGNKPVKIARDGQQLEAKVGKKLCKRFTEDSRDMLIKALDTLRNQINQRKRSTERRTHFYPLGDRRSELDPRFYHPGAMMMMANPPIEHLEYNHMVDPVRYPPYHLPEYYENPPMHLNGPMRARLGPRRRPQQPPSSPYPMRGIPHGRPGAQPYSGEFGPMRAYGGAMIRHVGGMGPGYPLTDPTHPDFYHEQHHRYHHEQIPMGFHPANGFDRWSPARPTIPNGPDYVGPRYHPYQRMRR